MRSVKSRRNGLAAAGLLLMTCVLVTCRPGPAAAPQQQATIEELKGPGWEKYVSQTVTVEAIFVRDPLPMLVTDLDLVLINMPIPEDQYILLVGEEAEGIDPEEYGGAKLRLTGRVVTADEIQYEGEYVALADVSYEMLERLEPYSPGQPTSKLR
jgi:hypothetical protein